MIVLIPKDYARIIERLKDASGRFFRLKAAGDYYELHLFTSISLDRTLLRLTEHELKKFYNDIKVFSGIKKRGSHHIAFIPKRPVKVTVRFSEEEASLIKKAAKREGTAVADFIRQSVLAEIFAPREEE